MTIKTPPRTAAAATKEDDTDLDINFGELRLDEVPPRGIIHIPTGTAEDPFRFKFVSHAWKHPYGFMIRLKSNKIVGNRARWVLEIFKVVDAAADDWVASLVTEGEYALRAINFKVPAMGYWEEKHYEELKHSESDPNSKIEARHMLTDYQSMPAGEKTLHYQMVIENMDMYLDNHAISQDEVHIVRQFQKLEGKPPLFKGHHNRQVGALWEVAVYDDNAKVLRNKNASAADLW